MKQFWEGVFTKNPVFVLALGLVPAVAVTTTALSGLALGLITAIIMVVAAVIDWLLVSHVPDNAKLPVRVLVLILLVVGAYSLLLRENPGLVASLGIFLPLVAFNDLLLQPKDEEGSLAHILLGTCGSGLGFALALVILGIIREFLGMGSVFGQQIVTGRLAPLSLAGSVPGGLVIVGLLMAVVNVATKRGGELHD